jgi:hypothetical protein
MKIFGKRKSTPVADRCSTLTTSAIGAAAGDDVASPVAGIARTTAIENDNVPSYFSGISDEAGGGRSSRKKKQRCRDDAASRDQQINGEDIGTLLAMDPSSLNAKQRRLVRRHREREGVDDGTDDAAAIGAGASSNDELCVDDKPEIRTEAAKSNETRKHENDGGVIPPTDASNDQSTDASDVNINEILAKLEGLNSKDRRKFLRQLKMSSGGAIDEGVIAAAEETALRVAERNEREAAANAATEKATAVKKLPRKKNGDERRNDSLADHTTEPKKKRRKKGPAVDVSALSPEERTRREEQRAMQREAAERRAAGSVDPDRHPLNSERRRANRRKPGKAALIALAKKERMAERGKFNAFGYQKRKGGEGGT